MLNLVDVSMRYLHRTLTCIASILSVRYSARLFLHGKVVAELSVLQKCGFVNLCHHTVYQLNLADAARTGGGQKLF